MTKDIGPSLDDISSAQESNEEIKKAYEIISQAETIIRVQKQVIHKAESVITKGVGGRSVSVFKYQTDDGKGLYMSAFDRKINKSDVLKGLGKFSFLKYIDFDRSELISISRFPSDISDEITVNNLPDGIGFKIDKKTGEHNFIHQTDIILVEDPEIYRNNTHLKSEKIEFAFWSHNNKQDSIEKTLYYLDYRR